MDENQSDIALPDITEAEHLGANDVENSHENGDQVNSEYTIKSSQRVLPKRFAFFLLFQKKIKKKQIFNLHNSL